MRKIIIAIMMIVAMAGMAAFADEFYCIRDGHFGKSTEQYWEQAIQKVDTIEVQHTGRINHTELKDGKYALTFELVNSKTGVHYRYIRVVTGD